MDRLRNALDGFYAFLARPLYLWSRPVLLLMTVPLLLAAFLPLWRFELQAPQFPNGLSVDVYSYTLVGGHDGADLRDLNALNHYVGMKRIDPTTLNDLGWLPFGFGAIVLLVLRVAAIGNVSALVDLSVITTYFAAFSGARFIHALHGLGHHLSADAPIKLEPFTPPLMGAKQIGTINSYAQPGAGAWMLVTFVAAVLVLTTAHLVIGKKKAEHA